MYVNLDSPQTLFLETLFRQIKSSQSNSCQKFETKENLIKNLIEQRPLKQKRLETHSFSEDVTDIVDLEERGFALVAGLVHVVDGVDVGGLGAGHQQSLHHQLRLQLVGKVGASAGGERVRQMFRGNFPKPKILYYLRNYLVNQLFIHLYFLSFSRQQKFLFLFYFPLI